MENLAKNFLTKAEQERVNAAVREVELTTSGEIVPMIVSRSHEYPMAAMLGSLFLSIPASLLLAGLIGPWLWLGRDSMWLFLAICLVSFTACHLLIKRSGCLTRFFLDRREADREIQEGAIAAFYAEKLHKTAGENGILLYISVLEQKVWILADAGINQKIDPSQWHGIVEGLTAGIRDGRRCQALCDAIRLTGQILATHFPRQQGDRDELHNLIIR
ncbi:MAG: TPM domain-containing protein [Desulforhopalus sp.]|nr:TPM domain-containing protein [Desulforhopalus sp.]